METQCDVDFSALARLKQIGGDDLVRRMLTLFSQYAPARVDDAVLAGRSRDLRGVARAAHALRSSAGNVGATRLNTVASQLERAAMDERMADVRELLLNLDDAFTATRRHLAPMMPSLS